MSRWSYVIFEWTIVDTIRQKMIVVDDVVLICRRFDKMLTEIDTFYDVIHLRRHTFKRQITFHRFLNTRLFRCRLFWSSSTDVFTSRYDVSSFGFGRWLSSRFCRPQIFVAFLNFAVPPFDVALGSIHAFWGAGAFKNVRQKLKN